MNEAIGDRENSTPRHWQAAELSCIWKVLDTAGKSGVRGEAGRMTAIRLQAGASQTLAHVNYTGTWLKCRFSQSGRGWKIELSNELPWQLVLRQLVPGQPYRKQGYKQWGAMELFH